MYIIIPTKIKDELSQIQIICKNDFKPSDKEILDILTNENKLVLVEEIFAFKDGKIRVINLKHNFFRNIKKENWASIVKKATNLLIQKENQISIKKGMVVILKDNTEGTIIRYNSNLDLELETAEKTKFKFTKEDIFKTK